MISDYHLAERVGFEPTVHRSAQRFSRPSDSTTLAPLQVLNSKLYNRLADILVLILMIFNSNERSNFPTKVVNIIKNQNPFSV